MSGFIFENHGSIFLVHPQSDAAREHLRDNVQDDATWFAGALVVEPRYAQDLATQLTDDGFVVV